MFVHTITGKPRFSVVFKYLIPVAPMRRQSLWPYRHVRKRRYFQIVVKPYSLYLRDKSWVLSLRDAIGLFCLVGMFWGLPGTGLAQNLESIGTEKPILVSGGISASQIFYTADGIESRRDPYSYFLTGNLNLSLYGWSVPLSFALSNQNRSFQQPFNQFGLHPTYKWVTGHFGYANMSFSPYTLSGHIFRGAGVELVPGKFHFSAMVGQLQRAVPIDTVRNSVPAFERNGFGFKTGYRDGGDFAELSVFHGEDDVNSLNILPEDNSLLPEENLAIGLSLGKTIFEKLSVLSAEKGIAYVTKEIGQTAL